MNGKHTTVNISTVTILKVLLVVALVWFLIAIREIVLIFLIAVIVSSAIDPLADFLYRKKIPRALSVLLIYVVAIGIIALTGVLLAPAIGSQFKLISQSDVVSDFTSKIGLFKQNLNQFGIGKTISDGFKNFGSNLSSTLFQTTKGVFTGVVSIITVFVMSFYLTAEENGMKNFIKHLTPYKHQAYVMRLTNQIQKKIGYWVLGQLILSAVLFGLVFLGLTLLKVKFALVLALIAGILEIIPYIGPFVAGIITLFFVFLQSPALALAALILYVVIQQLESHILVPIIMSKSVGLNPILIILGILIGGTLGGVVGALVAIPILSGVSVFVTDVLEERTAEEQKSET